MTVSTLPVKIRHDRDVHRLWQERTVLTPLATQEAPVADADDAEDDLDGFLVTSTRSRIFDVSPASLSWSAKSLVHNDLVSSELGRVWIDEEARAEARIRRKEQHKFLRLQQEATQQRQSQAPATMMSGWQRLTTENGGEYLDLAEFQVAARRPTVFEQKERAAAGDYMDLAAFLPDAAVSSEPSYLQVGMPVESNYLQVGMPVESHYLQVGMPVESNYLQVGMPVDASFDEPAYLQVSALPTPHRDSEHVYERIGGESTDATPNKDAAVHGPTASREPIYARVAGSESAQTSPS
jgi:hypothetical protein